MAWLAELPDCFGANATITAMRASKRPADGAAAYDVTIESHDHGGMECHAAYLRSFTGEVVVDERGALVRATFAGAETVHADPIPSCHALARQAPLVVSAARSCRPATDR